MQLFAQFAHEGKTVLVLDSNYVHLWAAVSWMCRSRPEARCSLYDRRRNPYGLQ
jgi:hypothetical protein